MGRAGIGGLGSWLSGRGSSMPITGDLLEWFTQHDRIRRRLGRNWAAISKRMDLAHENALPSGSPSDREAAKDESIWISGLGLGAWRGRWQAHALTHPPRGASRPADNHTLSGYSNARPVRVARGPNSRYLAYSLPAARYGGQCSGITPSLESRSGYF